MKVYSYCYMAVQQIDDVQLNQLEDRTLNLLPDAEILGCARDTLFSKRSGLQRLLQILNSQPFDVLLIDDIQQIGSGDIASKFLQLLAEKNVRIVTAKGDIEPDKVTLNGKRDNLSS